MKATFLALALSSLASSAFAVAQEDGPQFVGATPIKGKVTAVRPLCPEGVTCFVNGTIIDLEFTLQGCQDQLGPVTYSAKSGNLADQPLQLFVSAINLNDARSAHTACFVAPKEYRSLTLINMYGQPQLTWLVQGADVAETSVAPAAEDATEEEAKFLTCAENVDHGATVTLYAGKNHAVTRAEYAETTLIDTQIVADMRVCSNSPATGPNADQVVLTAKCNDTSWTDGHEIELFEGGFSGIPFVKLYKGPADHQLLKNLTCKYED